LRLTPITNVQRPGAGLELNPIEPHRALRPTGFPSVAAILAPCSPVSERSIAPDVISLSIRSSKPGLD